MNAQDELRRAAEARQLLENPLLQEAFDAIQTTLINGMRAAPITDTLMHTQLVLEMKLLESVKQKLWTHVESGKLAPRTNYGEKR